MDLHGGLHMTRDPIMQSRKFNLGNKYNVYNIVSAHVLSHPNKLIEYADPIFYEIIFFVLLFWI
jgi:hypothetical protein